MGTSSRLAVAWMVGLAAASLPAWGHDVTLTGKSPNASLIELYTSEGCSSCPPAEAWLSLFKDSPRLWTEIFPVNFHVDYWDGAGWKDRFAQPAFTQRQKTYAARLGQDSVYTPEFVVDGRESREWFHGKPFEPGPSKHGELTVALHGDLVTGRYVPAPGESAAGLTWNVVLVGAGLRSDVQGGENGGRELVHDFVVLAFEEGPLTQAARGWHLKSGTADQPAALVAWVSAEDGTIVQVAGGWLDR